MTEAWQQNWETFVQYLAERLQAGESSDELSQRFGGMEITWRGILDEKSIDEMASLVGISLPRKAIEWGNGHREILDGISLPLAPHAIEQWKMIELGSPVVFSARFCPANFVFPPIQVTQLKSGRTIIMIGFTGGVPLSEH